MTARSGLYRVEHKLKIRIVDVNLRWKREYIRNSEAVQ